MTGEKEGRYSDAERRQYEASLKEYWDYTSTMDTAYGKGMKEGMEKGIAKGKEEGMAEGIAKGKEEGMAEGIAKGKEEGMAEGMAKGKEEGMAEATRSTALKMKMRGFTLEEISAITSLPVDEIEKL